LYIDVRVRLRGFCHFSLQIVDPLWKILDLLLWQSIFKRYESWSTLISTLFRRQVKSSFTMCVYFDHLKIVFTFFEVLTNLKILVVLVFLLKLVKEFIKYGISHFMPSLLSFFKE
jgi:hypothetical protein